MSKTTLGFILTGFIYLGLGILLGVLFLIIPDLRPLRTVHVHLNLVGFILFIVFGIAYHILPRFRGRPLHSESLAWFQLWLANAGIVGLVVFMAIGAYTNIPAIITVQAVFGVILAVAVYIFIYNMGRTLFGAAPKES